mgnify:CR=1 FL=1
MDADKETVRQFLQTYPKKTLDLDVLQDAFASWDYSRFRPAVAALLADGRMANADVNGAYNILRKSKQNFDFEGLCKGLLDSPLRIQSGLLHRQAAGLPDSRLDGPSGGQFHPQVFPCRLQLPLRRNGQQEGESPGTG